MLGSVLVILLVFALASGSRERLREKIHPRSVGNDVFAVDKFEALLQTLPDPDRLRMNLFDLTRYPHVFGVANVVPQMTVLMTNALKKIPNATVETIPFTGMPQSKKRRSL